MKGLAFSQSQNIGFQLQWCGSVLEVGLCLGKSVRRRVGIHQVFVDFSCDGVVFCKAIFCSDKTIDCQDQAVFGTNIKASLQFAFSPDFFCGLFAVGISSVAELPLFSFL